MSTNSCEYLKNLDKVFKTDPKSPLHHDNRKHDCRDKFIEKEMFADDE